MKKRRKYIDNNVQRKLLIAGKISVIITLLSLDLRIYLNSKLAL